MNEKISYNTLRKIKLNLDPEVYESLVCYLASRFDFVEIANPNLLKSTNREEKG